MTEQKKKPTKVKTWDEYVTWAEYLIDNGYVYNIDDPCVLASAMQRRDMKVRAEEQKKQNRRVQL